jgi:hypothetical protein
MGRSALGIRTATTRFRRSANPPATSGAGHSRAGSGASVRVRRRAEAFGRPDVRRRTVRWTKSVPFVFQFIAAFVSKPMSPKCATVASRRGR